MKLKIGFIQILPGKDTEENLRLGKEACIKAKELGADVALFPEMFSDGYYLPQDEEELKKLAVEKDSLTVTADRLFLTEFPGSGDREQETCAFSRLPVKRVFMLENLTLISFAHTETGISWEINTDIPKVIRFCPMLTQKALSAGALFRGKRQIRCSSFN